ncbi:MAG: hypothetical protein ACRC1R_09105 [Cetobacterium sp.]|uniref:hypothetical protein n=1 Tax=Cetobacterium sp. TaxID=2071632 RepID=UPI003F2D1EE0
MNIVLLNLRSKQNIGAYILKQLLNSGELSPKAELFILNKLRVLDATSGNIVNSIKILQDIDIENKNFPGASRTAISTYLYLVENECGNYKINVLILKNLLEARLYIISGNKEKALKCLNIANPLIDNLEKAFFTDLENLRLLTMEILHF